jgi:uncharacterized membrane protein
MIELFEILVLVIEVAAVALMLVGLTISTGRFLLAVTRGAAATAYRNYRREMGRTLILTFEFLIAADIIETIIVDQTLTSLGMLGLLVLIRTFLSFALEMEITGRWPWQGGDEASAGN